LSRARDIINRLEEVLMAFLLALMTVLTALQVLLMASRQYLCTMPLCPEQRNRPPVE
jgi:TRAP-type C4-dicarboxylate transport system permease small subunit